MSTQEKKEQDDLPWYRARSTFGRRPTFSDHEHLWAAVLEYLDWVERNPLYAAELVKFQGTATLARVPKMRVATLGGLQIFLDIGHDGWAGYREKSPEFAAVCAAAEQAIREQKFAGAAADLLNANIIARDLGLVDKQEHEVRGVLGRDPVSADEWEAQHSK